MRFFKALRPMLQSYGASVHPLKGSSRVVLLRACSSSPTEESAVKVSKVGGGLAVGLEVQLPSKDETCLFTLKPFSNTVGDFYSMITQEDGGVERIAVYRETGIKCAKSTTISELLREPFKLVLNDRHFPVSPPDWSEFKELADGEGLREHVHEVGQALGVVERRQAKEAELLSSIAELRRELMPLQKAHRALEERSKKQVDRLTWVGLSLMGFQFGFLARLTWYEYSWDIMEPVTYFVTYGTAAAMYAYYTLTKQDYVFPDVSRRLFWLSMHKGADKQRLDVSELSRLQGDLEEKERALLRHIERS